MTTTGKTLYSDYLQLDKLLSSQDRFSVRDGNPAHDEMLFIIVHQVYELWFRQILFELDSVLEIMRTEPLRDQEMRLISSRMKRIVEILDLAVRQFRVLETMTALDFLDFRGSLGTMSGFQSVQFRLLENKLGLRRQERISFNASGYDSSFRPDAQKTVQTTEHESSLFELVQAWLERTPFIHRKDFHFEDSYRQSLDKMMEQEHQQVNQDTRLTAEEKEIRRQRLGQVSAHYEDLLDENRYNHMVTEGHRRLSHQAMLAALFIHLYRDYPMLQMPYQLLQTVQEVDSHLTHWRYRHSLMIQKMIGAKMGTGGSSGHSYLRDTVEKHQVFADFNHLSTLLLPRASLSALPETLQRDLNFYYSQTD